MLAYLRNTQITLKKECELEALRLSPASEGVGCCPSLRWALGPPASLELSPPVSPGITMLPSEVVMKINHKHMQKPRAAPGVGTFCDRVSRLSPFRPSFRLSKGRAVAFARSSGQWSGAQPGVRSAGLQLSSSYRLAAWDEGPPLLPASVSLSIKWGECLYFLFCDDQIH